MNDLSQLITTFVDPIALLMALAFAISIVNRSNLPKHNATLMLMAMFSIAVIYAMSDPIVIPNGGIFDMRSLLIGTATGLLGAKVGGAALATAVTYRVIIGGIGLMPGIGGMVIAFAAGLTWRYWLKDSALRLWKRAGILGLMISLQSLSIFLAPQETWLRLFMTLGPYIVVANVFGAVLITYLVEREMSHLSESVGMRHAASIDHLTGLLNRRSLEQVYADTVGPLGPPAGVSLLYIDIDNFKTVNDQFGHGVGDKIICSIVDRIKETLRITDHFARVGGDEFVILLPGVDVHQAEKIAARCCVQINREPIAHNEISLATTVSVGAIWFNHNKPLEEALVEADAALYTAKQQGRDRMVFHEASLNDHQRELQIQAH